MVDERKEPFFTDRHGPAQPHVAADVQAFKFTKAPASERTPDKEAHAALRTAMVEDRAARDAERRSADQPARTPEEPRRAAGAREDVTYKATEKTQAYTPTGAPRPRPTMPGMGGAAPAKAYAAPPRTEQAAETQTVKADMTRPTPEVKRPDPARPVVATVARREANGGYAALQARADARRHTPAISREQAARMSEQKRAEAARLGLVERPTDRMASRFER